MNKIKNLLTIAIIFTILPNAIYADCTTEEIKHFKKIEKDYKVTYEFNKDTETYTITFYNPEPDNYDYAIYGIDDMSSCKEINRQETKCENLLGNNYYLQIVGITETCNDTLKEVSTNLSRQNNYWDDPLCEGIEEFVLCQPTYDKEIDYDTFVSRVNIYKKTKQREETKSKEEKENKIIDNLINFIKDNLLNIVLIIIFVVAITITVILAAKSIRKSRRLE